MQPALHPNPERNTQPGRNTSPAAGLAHLQRVLQPFQPAEEHPSLTFEQMSVSPPILARELVRSLPAIVDGLEADILPVAVADFDGTLIRDSSGGFFLQYGAERGFFLPIVREQLNQMLLRFNLNTPASETPDNAAAIGADVLRVKAAFERWLKDGSVSAEERSETTRSFYAMCSWIFAGHTPEEVRKFGEELLVHTGYGTNYFAGARDIVNTLREHGISTMVVSATTQEIVEAGARYFGIAPAEVRGMRLALGEDGRFLPQVIEPVTFREGKVAAAHLLLKELRPIGDHTSVRPLFALGDSPAQTDQQLLEFAEIAIVVEPQTPKDAEYAKALINAGRRSFILDFERTIAGEPANKFRRELEVQREPEGNYL